MDMMDPSLKSFVLSEHFNKGWIWIDQVIERFYKWMIWVVLESNHFIIVYIVDF